MFSRLSLIATSTSFFVQLFYIFPEQQRQIKIIQRHLKIQDVDMGSSCASGEQGVKKPYKIDLRGWIEANKYD